MGKVKVLLVLAILTSFVIRFWKLPSLPFPPNGDEVAFGYYGWSLVHFGTDEYGNRLPLYFPSIGDFKYPGLAYLDMVPALIFGPTDITTRFWDATSGVVLVALIYLLAMLIFSSPFAAIASAWLVALSPWSIIESRLGYENHVSIVLTTAGIVSLLFSFGLKKTEKSKRNLLTFISFVLVVFSSFTYSAQRIFIPLMFLALFAISFLAKSELAAHKKTLLAFFISLSLIIAIFFLPPGSRVRAEEESWKGLTSQETDRLQQLYMEAGISPIKIPARVTWFFHNKYRIALIDFLARYADHFSPSFLFFQGKASPEKIPDMGMLLFVELLLLPTGLLALLAGGKGYRPLIVLAWLFIAPIASALTLGEAQIHRASMMIVPIALISGYGATRIIDFFRGKVRVATLTAIVLGIAVSSLYSLNQIFVQKPVDRPWYKEQVNKDLTEEILKLKGNYKAVVTGDDDYIFFLYYGVISPKEFLTRADITPLSSAKNWKRVNRLDNIYFKMPFDCPKGGKLNVLYVCKGGDVPQNSKIIKTFYYLDGVPAYSLLEFYPVSRIPSPLPELPKNLHYMVEVERSPKFPDGIIPDSYPYFW